MQNKIRTYVNFAAKAGQLVFGVDAILQTKNVYLIFIEATLPLKMQEKLKQKVKNRNMYALQVLAEDMFLLTNKHNVKAVGIANISLADAIWQENKQSKLYAEVQ